MIRHFTWLLFAFTLCSSPAVAAQSTPLFTQLYPQSKTITLAYFSGEPLLMVFWRSDCAPCRTEQPILLEIARAHPRLQIALVSLQDKAHTQSAFTQVKQPNIHVLMAQDDAKKVLNTMGDKRSILPFSAYYYSDGTVCDTHYGVLGTGQVNEWINEC